MATARGCSRLGAVLSVSSEYLRRLFRQGLGLAPRAYVIRRRMERAGYLLQTTKLLGKEISRKLGFIDEAYFQRSFVKHYGMTPRGYRESANRRP